MIFWHGFLRNLHNSLQLFFSLPLPHQLSCLLANFNWLNKDRCLENKFPFVTASGQRCPNQYLLSRETSASTQPVPGVWNNSHHTLLLSKLTLSSCENCMYICRFKRHMKKEMWVTLGTEKRVKSEKSRGSESYCSSGILQRGSRKKSFRK